MYRPGKPPYGPPRFGPPPAHGPPFTARARCGVPPPGHFVPGPCGPFVASGPSSQFLHSRPPGRPFTSPHCSSASVDHSALGSSQRMVCPAEPPFPQWNLAAVEPRRPDNSDQAGEEFLRCIADNKPLPDHLKGNMAYNLADAIRTANALKEAVKSDLEFQHMTKRKSRTRSRSRDRSRGKSRAKSRVRSKSRARSRSRGRHRSRARGRSRAKSKSRPRSRSPSQSRKKSHVRSKSQVRRSRSGSSERSAAEPKKRKRSSSRNRSENSVPRSSLLDGLKMVMDSRELEERLPSLKEAILTIQGSCESKKGACAQSRHEQVDSRDSLTSLESDSVLLPHDRVGSDFSWLQANSHQNVPVQKVDALEDEESFLYGNENSGLKEANKHSAALFPAFINIGQHGQQHNVPASCSQQFYNVISCDQTTASGLANLDSSEYEKIKEILKSVGTSDMSEATVKMQGQAPVRPGSVPATPVLSLSNPSVRQALESLQCLIQATKDRQAKNDVSDSSQTSDKHKEGDEERKQRKQVIVCEMESLLKELDGLLKLDELGFLTPVLGLYCQKCEEFFGDLNCAESHAAIHQNNTSTNKVDKHGGNSEGHSHCISSSNQQRDHDAGSYHHRNNREDQQDRRNERDHRSIHSGELSSHSATTLRKERMLITVSGGRTPPSVRAKDEEKAAGSHGRAKMEEKAGMEKASKDGTDKASTDRRGSSQSSDSDTGKAPKAKSLKKKKKKKKKRKKRDSC